MNIKEVMATKKQIKKTINFKQNVYMVLKRFFDIFFSIIGLVFLLFLVFIVKIAYMLSGDFESIFFNQERIGKDGKLFKMYKFRTMVPGADEILKKMLKEDKKIKAEYDKYKKLENDPRITKVGKILRKFSLDEFPQFINIFIGNMSLVGPRPYLYREKKDMGKYFDVIKQVKPGLTGYWQVNGRNNTDFKERLLLEEKYVLNRNLCLDIKIVFMTFIKVIKKDGAK